MLPEWYLRVNIEQSSIGIYMDSAPEFIAKPTVCTCKLDHLYSACSLIRAGNNFIFQILLGSGSESLLKWLFQMEKLEFFFIIFLRTVEEKNSVWEFDIHFEMNHTKQPS